MKSDTKVAVAPRGSRVLAFAAIMTTNTNTLSRRRLLRVLAAAGITGPAAIDLLAQARSSVSVENLRQAAAILGERFGDDRLAVIRTALQRNLDQFQIVRDLEIDDLVEPAPAFDARRR